MVGNTVVTIEKTLRDSGWELLRRIQAVGMPLSGMFWAEFDENDWRLFIVTPLIDEEGAGAVFKALRPLFPLTVVSGKDGEIVTMDDLNPISPDDPTTRGARDWARRRYGTEDGSVADDEDIVRRVSLTPNDAYIYYLAPTK